MQGRPVITSLHHHLGLTAGSELQEAGAAAEVAGAGGQPKQALTEAWEGWEGLSEMRLPGAY